MVCLGNICRSPLAEGILRKYLPESKFIIDSAATASYHPGNPPDFRSIEVAYKNGVNIKNIRSRQFTLADFKTFDHIFVMDKKNLRDILFLSNNNKSSIKVKLLIDNEEVPDPYYGGSEGFADCFKLIDIACEKIANDFLENE